MIVFVSALFFVASPDVERPRGALLRDLTTNVVKLTQARGSAARMEGLGRVAERISQEAVTLSAEAGRTEEALYLSLLALQLVTRGIAPKLPGTEDDHPDDDLRWAAAVDSSKKVFEAAQTVRSALAEDQRPRIQGDIDMAGPVVRKMSDWIAARAERHGTKIAPPDDSGTKPEEKKKEGPVDEERPN